MDRPIPRCRSAEVYAKLRRLIDGLAATHMAPKLSHAGGETLIYPSREAAESV